MSFESYAHHIAQKHRLAIALAVLKDKPESVTIENYLEDLRNKINDGNTDDEITVCSEDFNLDDDNFNENNDLSYTHSINDNSIACNNDKPSNNDTTNNNPESVSILVNFATNDLRHIDKFSKNDMQNVDRSFVCNNDKPFINDTTNINQESVSILKTLTGDYLKNNDKHSINVIETVDRSIVRNNDKLFNNDTTIKSQESVSILRNLNDNDIQRYGDLSLNRKSVMHKDVIVNDSRIMNVNDINTHRVSLLIDIGNRMDLDCTRLGNNNVRSIEDKNQTKVQPQIVVEVETEDVNSTYYNTQMYENAQNDYSNISEILRKETIDLTGNEKNNSQLGNFDINVGTQNFTHVSQSQNDNIVINENLFKKVSSTAKPSIVDNNLKINEDITSFKPITNEDSRDTLNKYSQMEVDTQETHFNTQSIEQSLQTQQTTTEKNDHRDNINEHDEEINDLNEGSQTELIPFKVIEELNKVKTYLNKTVQRRTSIDASLDSGYKSDSQSRSSFRNSSQSSVSFLNQSGHCLFNFIITAPVLISAQDIINEIAQVLAQLIDRLHEEEKYLVFLDELLEKIDFLLQDVLAGSCDENLLLRKDEDIQRLLLLNISRNIQKYTINKIITILEKIQTELSSTEDLYEISNTDESENLCYIFHILEVLLKRYVKIKDSILTPKSSQTDLKKSSITDIWKKKWNPNFKSTELLEISPKACVLTKCSEVLNKLVVSCMDGYSLISFAALQCFNILQL